jgi:SOS response regulatory protein OraA/RecX
VTHVVTGLIVTALRERKRNRVAVELDGRPWRVLPTDAVVRAGLAVGRPLDRHTARELAREVRRARALAQATRTLATSGRSRRELERRLTLAGHAGAAREEALATLDRAGLVDDARLAEDRAELLARRGYGDAAIRADLRRRLVEPEAAAAAVAALEPEPERLRRLLEAQSVTPALLRRLAGRGFSRDALDDVASSFAPEA